MDNNIQNVNSQPPIKPYMPPETKATKINKGLIIGAAAGIVFIAAIVLVLVLLVFPVSRLTAGANEPLPLVYMEDDEVYLAVGTRIVELEDAVVVDGDKINSQISYDGRYFIFLADVDEETGAGDLMLIDLKGDLKPKTIEKEVCAAKMSAFGDNIVFLRDIEDGEGTLYYAIVGQNAKEIEDDVIIDSFNISTDGDSFYYFTRSGEDTSELYLCAKGAEPEKIIEIDNNKGESIYVKDLTNGGALIYEYIEDTDSKLYEYRNGKEEKMASDATIEIAFDPEYRKLLYSDGDSLYYKVNSESKDRVTKDFYDLRLPYYRSAISVDYNYRYGVWYGLNNIYDTHFLLVEKEEDAEEVSLYEMRIGTEPIRITEADSWGYSISPDFKWVSFERDGELCLTYKDRKGWSDRIEICDNSMGAVFNERSRYLYYIDISDRDEDDYGDLYRYELTSGEHEPELLQYDVEAFTLYNGAVIALTTDGELYSLYSKEDRKLMCDEDYIGGTPAPNGVYVFTEANDYDVYFVNMSGEGEEICFDASAILDIGSELTHYFIPES